MKRKRWMGCPSTGWRGSGIMAHHRPTAAGRKDGSTDLVGEEAVGEGYLPVGHEGHGAVLRLPQRRVDRLDHGRFLRHGAVVLFFWWWWYVGVRGSPMYMCVCDNRRQRHSMGTQVRQGGRAHRQSTKRKCTHAPKVIVEDGLPDDVERDGAEEGLHVHNRPGLSFRLQLIHQHLISVLHVV